MNSKREKAAFVHADAWVQHIRKISQTSECKKLSTLEPGARAAQFSVSQRSAKWRH